MKIALVALPALVLLSACAAERPAPPPPPMPMAAAPTPPPPAPMPGMDGRYVGTARLMPGQRACSVRTANVSANVMGEKVTVMSGRRTMDGMLGPDGTVTFSDGMMTGTRFENGMLMGESTMNNCRYTVSLHKAGMARHGRPMRHAM